MRCLAPSMAVPTREGMDLAFVPCVVKNGAGAMGPRTCSSGPHFLHRDSSTQPNNAFGTFQRVPESSGEPRRVDFKPQPGGAAAHWPQKVQLRPALSPSGRLNAAKQCVWTLAKSPEEFQRVPESPEESQRVPKSRLWCSARQVTSLCWL